MTPLIVILLIAWIALVCRKENGYRAAWVVLDREQKRLNDVMHDPHTPESGRAARDGYYRIEALWDEAERLERARKREGIFKSPFRTAPEIVHEARVMELADEIQRRDAAVEFERMVNELEGEASAD